MLVPKQSDLTPEVVDSLYHIDSATPDESPTFLFLVGAPGSGKSSGHARAIDAGILPAGNYATVNVDTLLESLLPFRAATSMAHYLKYKLATIGAYGSRKENLGLFKWYDEQHNAMEAEDPSTIHEFNRIRRQFESGQTTDRLLDIHEDALERAIHKRVHIIYETTLSLTRKGRVNKVDTLMNILNKTPYRVVFYHITGSPENIKERIRARQEHATPQDIYPFYRYVPTGAIAGLVQATGDAFEAVRRQYHEKATFEEFENPTDPLRLPAENRRTASTRRRRIISAYARRTSSQKRRTQVSLTRSRRRI
jgi:hypothetical protein